MSELIVEGPVTTWYTSFGEDLGQPLQGQLRRLHSWVWVTGVGRGLQIEVEFLDDERASIPAFSKDPSGVLPCLMLFCFA